MSLLDGYNSLSENINKVQSTEEREETILTPELELDMDDKELIDLKRTWVKSWEAYAGDVEKIQKENEAYWLGEQFNPTKSDRPLRDNLIFESLETFLPIATRPKAEPLVEADNSDMGNALADKVRRMLSFLADQVNYNIKLKQVARYWALYLLGVMKVGWSMRDNEITCIPIRPQKLILDPKGTVSEGEYTGYYIGEKIEAMASDLVERFPNKKDYITEKVNEKMGTTIEYIQWCTDEYFFWTIDDQVLGKSKNPHWNYEEQVEKEEVDEYGNINIVQDIVGGKNHFKYPKKPYIFLSIFNLGKRPHDDTNLIQQNLPLQDLVNKRLEQIDMNADNANNGLVMSGDAFTEEQAMVAGKKRRKGAAFWVPTGDVNTAFKDVPAQPLPSFIYESLIDYRNEIRNIFGTRGSTPQGIMKEETLGGKQIIKGQDTDRIGGGVSTYLEQFSDKVFNWFVQLMYVYYDEPHTASVLGAERTKEYIQLTNQEFETQLTIGVKEGSMVPQDPMSKRNEAIALWGQKGIDPIEFFNRLEFPNPRESAKNLYLWQADPIRLFPDLYEEQQQQQAMQQEQQMQQQQMNQEQEYQMEQERAERDKQTELERIQLQALSKQ